MGSFKIGLPNFLYNIFNFGWLSINTFNKEKIIESFYTTNKYVFNSEKKTWNTDFNPENFKRPIKLSYDLIDANNGKKILSKGEKLNVVIAKKLYEQSKDDILSSMKKSSHAKRLSGYDNIKDIEFCSEIDKQEILSYLNGDQIVLL